MHTLLFLAQDAAPQQPGGGLGGLLPMVLIIVMLYFLLIRPQQKRQKEAAAMVAALKTGDHVVTAGGFHGIITSVSDTTVTLKIADNVKIKLDRSSIARVEKSKVDSSGDFKDKEDSESDNEKETSSDKK